LLDDFHDRRLTFVTGKGGVGTSTLVASLGRLLAERGRRTLVVETDAYSAMEDLLEVDLADNAITPVDPPLYAVNLLASECVVEAIARFVPSKRIVRGLLNNRVAKTFFDTAPGVNQFAILDQVRQFLERTDGDRPRWDNIIVDLPASGHAVTFLSVPKTLRDIIDVGPIAEATGMLADLIGDADRTGVVAICLPEEMPVNETVEFEDELEEAVDRGVTLAFANMVHRAPLDPEHEEQFHQLVGRLDRETLLAETIHGSVGDARAVERVIAGNILALDWHDRDRRYLEELRERLDAPVHEIPVFYETDGRSIVSRIVEFLLGDGTEPERRAS